MPEDLAAGPHPLRRDQVRVECKAVGELRLLQTSSGGDAYGLSLLVDTIAGALALLWRLIVGRGRWRITVTERRTDRVVFSGVYKNRRAAEQHGMAQVQQLFGAAPEG